MDIWILNHHALPPSFPGGTRHFDIGSRLVARGHSVTLLAAAFDHLSGAKHGTWPAQAHHTEVVDGVRFVWLGARVYSGASGPGRVANMIDYTLSALRVSRHLSPPPDVIVGSTVHHLAGLAAWALSRRFAVPFVFEVRDIWPETLIDLGVITAHHPAVLLFRALDHFLLKRADQVISLLPLASERLVSAGADPQRIAYIPNGVDVSALRGGAGPPGPLRVMYVGAHGRANGLEVVLAAAQQVQSRLGAQAVQFILVGEGPAKSELIALASRLGLRNTTFRSAVPKSAVRATMQTANAFVFHLKDMPVLRFGVSANKLWDYMAAGRPTVFACATPKNPVATAKAGWTVPPENPDAMAQALLALAHHPHADRARMGRAAVAYVRQYHDLDRLALRFLHALTEARRHGYNCTGRRVVRPGGTPSSRASKVSPSKGTAAFVAFLRRGHLGSVKAVSLALKRACDILCSGLAILVLIPLFIVISTLVKLGDRGPVVYVDRRVGMKGRLFRMYKFRSMVVGAKTIGLGRATAEADPRVTPVGRVLRDYSLDELPQLVNVLKGEMSIVGPRPTIPDQVARYGPRERKRLDMRPGLTGWAQVHGRNALTWHERIDLDIWYIENWSLLLDLKIILKTPLVLLRREGLYGPEGVTLDYRGQ